MRSAQECAVPDFVFYSLERRNALLRVVTSVSPRSSVSSRLFKLELHSPLGLARVLPAACTCMQVYMHTYSHVDACMETISDT